MTLPAQQVPRRRRQPSFQHEEPAVNDTSSSIYSSALEPDGHENDDSSSSSSSSSLLSRTRQHRQRPNPTSLERVVTNIFLILLLFLLTLDAWPTDWIGGSPVQRLQRDIDIVMDVTGLWQGPWRLFSPDPQGQLVYVTATMYRYGYHFKKKRYEMIELPSSKQWRSPNWRNMTSIWERKRQFRMQEYIDAIRNEDNHVLWEPLAEYLATATAAASTDNKKPDMIVFHRHWRYIYGPAAPRKKGVSPKKDNSRHWLLGNKVQPTLGVVNQYEFYRWHSSSHSSTGALK